jgi:hypothetical protein
MKTNHTAEIKAKNPRKKKSRSDCNEKLSRRHAQSVADDNLTGRRFEKGYIVEKPE